jgi:hypothetical protein
VAVAKTCAGHDSTLKSRSLEPDNASMRMKGICRRTSTLQPSLAIRERSKIMPLIQLLEVLIVVGVLLWLVNRYIPMQGTIKSILNGVVVIAVVLWLLNVFGLIHSLSRIHVGT